MSDVTPAPSGRSSVDPSAAEAVRLIAFYLPQYHPIPENDDWWGRGFTEWSNVAKARPRYRWQHQPHLPADLGFYDLRLPEARAAQADLARSHGINAFCYYHYWFAGRRLLERPFEQVLASGEPDFPFCLCWANESWTRAWDGSERQILMPQRYDAEDDRAHARSLVRAFGDDRYVRVGGRPLVLIYRASLLPDPRATAEVWRQEARSAGIGDLHLCQVESFGAERCDPATRGFDAAVEFAPDWRLMPVPAWRQRWHAALRRVLGRERLVEADHVFSYDELAERSEAKPDPGYCRYPCVCPGFDNTSRRRRGATILRGETPQRYRAWLSEVVRRQSAEPPEHRLVFVNAWNEWAEGNHLEPDARWGRAFLDATRDALASARDPRPDGRVADRT